MSDQYLVAPIAATQEPLIYTSNGNVLLSSVTLETVWDIQDRYIKFIERYRDADGVVVKESAHVYSKHGVTAESAVASMG